jgi:hypothetical protein
MTSYPYEAGFRENQTSKLAANAIEDSGRAETLRNKVLGFLYSNKTGTADEIASALDEPIWSIQPRISELRAQGLLIASGLRRKSARGGTAHVWVKAPIPIFTEDETD